MIGNLLKLTGTNILQFQISNLKFQLKLEIKNLKLDSEGVL